MKSGIAAVTIWLGAAGLAGCSGASEAQPFEQRPAEGRPYELAGTQVWSVPDPGSGRSYEVFVNLPANYQADSSRRYPVMYVTDADYGFPVIRAIGRRINAEGPAVEDFILVGLSYARGETGMASRRRDYTPTPNGPSDAPPDALHGQAKTYLRYLKEQILPFVERRFRADPARRIYMGHSYGGLLGSQILLSDPTLFRDYILGSPSFWYDNRHMLSVEQAYADNHRDLPANIFFYVGALEAIRQGDGRYNQKVDLVADMKLFEDRLRSRRYPGLTIKSVVLADENHLTVFPSGLTKGLLHVLPHHR